MKLKMNKHFTKPNFGFCAVLLALVVIYLMINVHVRHELSNKHQSPKTNEVLEDPDELDSKGKLVSLSPILQQSREKQIRWMNSMKPKQNDPVLLRIVRKWFLIPPNGLPFTGTYGPQDYSGQPEVDLLLNFTQHKRNGFFFDSAPGTNDALPKSSTVYLERAMNWTGLIIQPNPTLAQELIHVKRNVWKANVCISPIPYPMETIFIVEESTKAPNTTAGNFKIKCQCLPIGTILLAINKNITVDYFNLGSAKNLAEQYYVFVSFPFDKIKIKAINVGVGAKNISHDPRLTQLDKLLSNKGFQNVSEIGGADADYILYKNQMGQRQTRQGA